MQCFEKQKLSVYLWKAAIFKLSGFDPVNAASKIFRINEYKRLRLGKRFHDKSC